MTPTSGLPRSARMSGGSIRRGSRSLGTRAADISPAASPRRSCHGHELSCAFSGYGDILGDWYLRPNPLHLRSPLVPDELAREGLGHGEVSEADGEERWRFYRYCRQRGTWPREVSGLDPVADRDALEAYCPVRHVSASFPPALFLHGDADKDVPHQESIAMVNALRAVGADAGLITVPRCGHLFEQVGTAQAREAFARVVEFLRGRLG